MQTHGNFINQSLSYPINVECQARKEQVSILYFIGLTQPRFELQIYNTRGMCPTDSATAPGEPKDENKTAIAHNNCLFVALHPSNI